jgi:hypothetical protein
MAKVTRKSSPEVGVPAKSSSTALTSKHPTPSIALSSCPYNHLNPRKLADKLGRVKRDGSGASIRFLERWRRSTRKSNGLEYGPPFHTTVNAALYCISPEFDEWFNRYTTRTRAGLPPGLSRWQAEQRAKKQATEGGPAHPLPPSLKAGTGTRS